jgi:hypothetical protein
LSGSDWNIVDPSKATATATCGRESIVSKAFAAAATTANNNHTD